MPYKLSNDKRNNVISLIKAGKGTTDIVQATGVSKAQVVRMKKEHDPDRIKSRGGRVSTVPDFTKRAICFRVRKGFLLSAKDVQRYLWSLGYKLQYSSTTKLMRSLGLNSMYKKKKPLIQKTRLQWAKKHRDWTVEDWNEVIFSDETKINRWGSDGAQITWKHKDDPLRPHNYQTQLKGGGGSMMVWGCMTSSGVGYACRIDEYPMNSELYTHILATSYKETLEYFGLSNEEVIFQQDGDTKHTSKHTKKWLADNGIRYIEDWPANSPDLNPIEHLWRHVKLKLDAYDTKPKNMGELWDRFDKEWNTFTKDDIKKYYESMPKRIQAVIKAKGGYTKL